MIQPAFHKQQLARFGPIMSQAAAGLCERLEQHARTGKVFDVVPEFLRVTLEVVGKALLSVNLSQQADQLGRAFRVILENTMTFASAYVRLPLGVPTPANRRFQRAVSAIDRQLFQLIQERRQHRGQHADLMSLLLSARDEASGARLDDRQLRNELITLVFAGHETTATALSWTIYHVARDSKVCGRLERELSALHGAGPATVDDLAQLPYTRMALEESMRLHPPVWVIPRKSIAEAEFGGFRLPARASTIVSPYVTQRDPVLWKDPETFEPERFAADSPQAAERPRYAYFPFGGGPHICIGAGLAMMESQIILASVVRHFRFELAPDERVSHRALVALRPHPGIHVRVHAR